MPDPCDPSRLSDLEHVRARPALYVGDTGSPGLHHLAWEIIANSIQEVEGGWASRIEVTVFKDGSLAIEDNGRGIPIEMDPELSIQYGREFCSLEGFMTRLRYDCRSRKRDRSKRSVFGGRLAVVNFLTKRCEVEVSCDQKTYRQVYQRGVVASPVEISDARGRQGTRITLWPDEQLFPDVEFDYELLRTRLLELAYLSAGLQIRLDDIRIDRSDTFCFKNGTADFIRDLLRHRSSIFLPSNIMHTQGRSGEVEYAVAVGYASNVVSFANDYRTFEGGTHLAAFHRAFTAALNETGQKLGMLDGLVLTRAHYEHEITALISVRLPNPIFQGATRTRLCNLEIEEQLMQEWKAYFCEYLERNPCVIRSAIGVARGS